MSTLSWLLIVLSAAWYAVSRAPAVATSSHGAEPIQPSHESARHNANRIFNAIHSAGRQWGSSLNHNGFGFVPAVVPRGTLLYHGSRSRHPPTGLQWLAFEVEHAQVFAVSYRCSRGDGHSLCRHGEEPVRPVTEQQQMPIAFNTSDLDGGWNSRGHLHTYRASRDLNVLYIDGMAAAKSKCGTLDSQDLLLRENKTGSWDNYMDEQNRAQSICDMITAWGYDGFVRIEIGFELIQCNFSHSLDLMTVTRSLMPRDQLSKGKMAVFQLARAVGRGFDGLGADRLRLDFSSMLSGFFFPINISHTDPERPDLIRLGAASLSQLKDIKWHLRELSFQHRRFTVDWQAIVDLIIGRFADRLALMVSSHISPASFIEEIEKATLAYFDAPALSEDIDAHRSGENTEEAIDRCSKHYLMIADHVEDQWSAEDRLILTAVDVVAHDICKTLFGVRSSFEALNSSINHQKLEEAFQIGQEELESLMQRLQWTEWKKTLPCLVDEVWFISMYPYGTKEDHWKPGCRSIEEMHLERVGYWDLDYFLPPDDPSGDLAKDS